MAPRKPIKKIKTEDIGKNHQEPGKLKESKNIRPSEFFSKVQRLTTDERTLFICGIFLFLIVLYVTFSFLSYFFTGAADQSKLDVPWSELKGMRTQIQNWTSVAGAYISEMVINRWFGLPAFAMLWFLIVAAFRLMNVRIASVVKTFFHCFFWLIWGSVFLGFALSPFVQDVLFFSPGGRHGDAISRWLISYIGAPGTFMLLLGMLLLYCIVSFQSTIPFLKGLFKRKPRHEAEGAAAPDSETPEGEPSVAVGTEIVPDEWIDEPMDEPEDETGNEDEGDNAIDLPIDNPIPTKGGGTEEDFIVQPATADGDTTPDTDSPAEAQPDEIGLDIDSPLDTEEGDPYYNLKNLGKYDPTLDLSHYEFPTLDLLKTYPNENAPVIDMDEQNANKDKIVTTLRNYGIEIDSIKANVGPTITLYEIVPKAGIRISKIRNLESDIMLSLAAIGIRIIAPIPGKGTIGIEVPNEKPQIVSMHSVIASKKFQEETKYALPVVLGRTITNEVFMFDLAKAPHLLVAGATGQGKSVGLNAIITSLLYKKHPSQLKFVLVDPKMVEFNIYAALEKHYMAKMPGEDNVIITDSTKVIQTLNSLVIEMEDRYKLLMAAHCRNIVEYNEKFINRQLNPEKGHRYLPYIVIVIDEFGDLIMVAGKEIEMPIARITQKARAVGMHMILATQRPSVNIITGVIKANVPGRVAFRVSSMIDSRTILDAPGANQLVGKGDLLYSGGSDLVRVQCAFVDTPEVESIVNYVSHQQAYPCAYELPEYVPENEGSAGVSMDSNAKRDPKFEEVARWVVAQQQGSTSAIQRTFEIGYNRAGRITDQLEAAGIVSANNGSKGRQVLIQDEYTLERLLNGL